MVGRVTALAVPRTAGRTAAELARLFGRCTLGTQRVAWRCDSRSGCSCWTTVYGGDEDTVKVLFAEIDGAPATLDPTAVVVGGYALAAAQLLLTHLHGLLKRLKFTARVLRAETKPPIACVAFSATCHLANCLPRFPRSDAPSTHVICSR